MKAEKYRKTSNDDDSDNFITLQNLNLKPSWTNSTQSVVVTSSNHRCLDHLQEGISKIN